MTDKLRAAAEMALKALQTAQNNLGPDYEWAEASGEGHIWDMYDDAIAALRQALAEPDTGIDRGAWSDVPDATKWVDELRGEE